MAFLALLLVVRSDLSMSPMVAARYFIIPNLLDGSQAGRTVHFACLCIVLLFLAAHLDMVTPTRLCRNTTECRSGREAQGGYFVEGRARTRLLSLSE